MFLIGNEEQLDLPLGSVPENGELPLEPPKQTD